MEFALKSDCDYPTVFHTIFIPSYSKSAAVSAAVHFSVLTAIAVWGLSLPAPDKPPELYGQISVLQMETPRIEPAIELEQVPLEAEVVVQPHRARVGHRFFTNTPPDPTLSLSPDRKLAELGELAAASFGDPYQPPDRDAQKITATTSQPKAALRKQAELAEPTERQVPLPRKVDTLGDTPPDFSGNPPPVHPAIAYEQGLHGTVYLYVSIAVDGLIRDIGIQQSSGHLVLDAAAVQAVRNWKFKPAMRRGRPVASRHTLPILFPRPVR